jgi:hypothetical protein
MDGKPTEIKLSLHGVSPSFSVPVCDVGILHQKGQAINFNAL